MSIESRFFDYDVEPDASRTFGPAPVRPPSRARFAIGMAIAAVLIAGGGAVYQAATDRTPIVAIGR